MTITIRPARLEDAEAIAVLCHQLGYPTLEEEARARLARIRQEDDHALLVAVPPDGHVVGWIHVYADLLLVSEPRAQLGGLVIEEARRGQGIGRQLLKKAEEWARDRSCQHLVVRSNVIRRDAHAFYAAMGYETVKRQQVFRKSLNQGDP